MTAKRKSQPAKKSEAHRYGRGKFDAHPDYVKYMKDIVEHPHYAGMPGAVSEGGRINWQVSSGKTTSFNKFYEARTRWWIAVADKFHVPGHGKGKSRFSVAARTIHPSGYRPCRLCGMARNVGYFYVNAHLARRLNAMTPASRARQGQPISEVLATFSPAASSGAPGGRTAASESIRTLFPERRAWFERLGVTEAAFEESRHIRSRWLSPGYMANPPDRLDGFHDYCVYCREKNDPGRAQENMRTYAHDRRAFMWWAEGDWKLADDLYNSAGPGACSYCDARVERVSPDHVGPLACGFKQVALFAPTCSPCNSSKNRRMTLRDVRRLIAYEESSGESVASWQIRPAWDLLKAAVRSDEDAAELSAHLRAVQDCYLRVLHALLEAGHARFLTSLLSPQHAYSDHEFTSLDPARLTFSAVRKTRNEGSGRSSLARRSVRIAFEELQEYAAKPATRRKLRAGYKAACEELTAAAVAAASRVPRTKVDAAWTELLGCLSSPDEFEAGVGKLLGSGGSTADARDKELRSVLENGFRVFAQVARSATGGKLS